MMFILYWNEWNIVGWSGGSLYLAELHYFFDYFCYVLFKIALLWNGDVHIYVHDIFDVDSCSIVLCI